MLGLSAKVNAITLPAYSEIKRLILSKDWSQTDGHLLTINFVLRWISDQYLQRNPGKQCGEIQNALERDVMDCVWDLVLEGVFAPGAQLSNASLPALRFTNHGKQCLLTQHPTPHDPDGYLRWLGAQCRTLDSVTLVYLREALQTFRSRNNIATVVMIGVAAESVFLRVVNAVAAAIGPENRREKFITDTKGKVVKRQHDKLIEQLRHIAPSLPSPLNETVVMHVESMFDIIRRYRNDAGHPNEVVLDELYEVNAILQISPIYCRTAHVLMDWLVNNRI